MTNIFHKARTENRTCGVPKVIKDSNTSIGSNLHSRVPPVIQVGDPKKWHWYCKCPNVYTSGSYCIETTRKNGCAKPCMGPMKHCK